MKLLIDLDGVICEELGTFERCMAKPLPNAVDTLKKLKWAGHHITIYTGRGWSEYAMTLTWLKKYDIPCDLLLCGKPLYDLWIDDRALKFINWDEIHNAITST